MTDRTKPNQKKVKSQKPGSRQAGRQLAGWLAGGCCCIAGLPVATMYKTNPPAAPRKPPPYHGVQTSTEHLGHVGAEGDEKYVTG